MNMDFGRCICFLQKAINIYIHKIRRIKSHKFTNNFREELNENRFTIAKRKNACEMLKIMRDLGYFIGWLDES